jgi:hypothetical protein
MNDKYIFLLGILAKAHFVIFTDLKYVPYNINLAPLSLSLRFFNFGSKLCEISLRIITHLVHPLSNTYFYPLVFKINLPTRVQN